METGEAHFPESLWITERERLRAIFAALTAESQDSDYIVARLKITLNLNFARKQHTEQLLVDVLGPNRRFITDLELVGDFSDVGFSQVKQQDFGPADPTLLFQLFGPERFWDEFESKDQTVVDLVTESKSDGISCGKLPRTPDLEDFVSVEDCVVGAVGLADKIRGAILNQLVAPDVYSLRSLRLEHAIVNGRRGNILGTVLSENGNGPKLSHLSIGGWDPNLDEVLFSGIKGARHLRDLRVTLLSPERVAGICDAVQANSHKLQAVRLDVACNLCDASGSSLEKFFRSPGARIKAVEFRGSCHFSNAGYPVFLPLPESEEKDPGAPNDPTECDLHSPSPKRQRSDESAEAQTKHQVSVNESKDVVRTLGMFWPWHQREQPCRKVEDACVPLTVGNVAKELLRKILANPSIAPNHLYLSGNDFSSSKTGVLELRRLLRHISDLRNGNPTSKTLSRLDLSHCRLSAKESVPDIVRYLETPGLPLRELLLCTHGRGQIFEGWPEGADAILAAVGKLRKPSYCSIDDETKTIQIESRLSQLSLTGAEWSTSSLVDALTNNQTLEQLDVSKDWKKIKARETRNTKDLIATLLRVFEAAYKHEYLRDLCLGNHSFSCWEGKLDVSSDVGSQTAFSTAELIELSSAAQRLPEVQTSSTRIWLVSASSPVEFCPHAHSCLPGNIIVSRCEGKKVLLAMNAKQTNMTGAISY